MSKLKFASIFSLLIIVFSCGSGGSENSSDNSQNPEISDSFSEENDDSTSADSFCEIEIDGLKGQTPEVELRSSNAIEPGAFTTTFNILMNEEMYEKHPLDVTLAMIQQSHSPKLSPGTYDIKAAFAPKKDQGSKWFDMLGNTVDESTYQNAINAGLVEDISDSYVVISHNSNQLTIESVRDIDSANDESEYYITGSQIVKGHFMVSLKSVATEKDVELKVDFEALHDWAVSK